MYGVSEDAGVQSKAMLLPQKTRAVQRNVHLEPMPRGALADLKPVQNSREEPGPNEIKVQKLIAHGDSVMTTSDTSITILLHQHLKHPTVILMPIAPDMPHFKGVLAGDESR